jgi:hypothetical protein
MNDRNDEFDARLEQLFAHEHTHLAAEPFASATLRALVAERKRASRLRRVLQAAGVIALVAASPLLLEGSVWLSARLDELFASAGSLLASPFGFAGVALGALLALATKWARIW